MKSKILIFLCLTFLSVRVSASEVIESFDSLIQVQTDGSMIVTENITARHEGRQIRRGIYRDLPTSKGEKYKLLRIRRNGHPEPGFVEKRSGYYRINTGNDNFLPYPATSTFSITYKVWNIPKSYNGFDEIYWNVTGNEWAFPIESVSASIVLPQGAEILQQSSYIGPHGSQEPARYFGDGLFQGRSLSPGEGLTIAVGFTPGIVYTKPYLSWSDYFRKMAPPVVYTLFLGFLIWAWNKKGRDPKGRTVMPQYEPPKDLSAAQAALLYTKGGHNNIFAISLIQMIVNGYLKLTVKKERELLLFKTVYILDKTGKDPANAEERIFWQKHLKFGGKHSSMIESMNRRLEDKTKNAMDSLYAKNHGWVLLPTFFCLLSLFLMWGIANVSLGDLAPFLFAPLLLTFLCGFIFKTLFRQIIYMSVFLGLMLFLHIAAGTASDVYQPIWVLLVLATASLFSYLMYAPTEKGQRLLEHLEGLKMFLKATRDPANIRVGLNEKCLEKLFPYAVALGLEKEWEKKFSRLFGREACQYFMTHHPYTSHSFSNSFSSNVSSSSHAPSSGGFGSGGGGCSGGGGGGGGGGGR